MRHACVPYVPCATACYCLLCDTAQIPVNIAPNEVTSHNIYYVALRPYACIAYKSMTIKRLHIIMSVYKRLTTIRLVLKSL